MEGDDAGGRLKSSRQRNVAAALRKVDAAGREAAISARLDALERDALPEDEDNKGDEDEEFVVEEPKLDGAMTKIVAKKKKGGKGGGARATRGAADSSGKALSAKTLRTFNQLLEANALDKRRLGYRRTRPSRLGRRVAARRESFARCADFRARTRARDAACDFVAGSVIRFTRKPGV